MAEFTIPPAFEPLVEACGEAALPAFQGADFANDPGAAFSEGMSAAMDVMADAGMPAPMMEMMQDFCSGAFEQHMAGGGDPMDAFDAVGSAIDGLMAPFPNDMPCADMAADFPPMPPDMGAFMDGCPPYGDFPGGEAFDAGAMPDTWEPGPMTDMGPEFGPEGPPPGEWGLDNPQPGPPQVWIWTVTVCLHHLQVIWDRDLMDQWDLLQEQKAIWDHHQVTNGTSSG